MEFQDGRWVNSSFKFWVETSRRYLIVHQMVDWRQPRAQYFNIEQLVLDLLYRKWRCKMADKSMVAPENIRLRSMLHGASVFLHEK
jgi:hypothetical protein